MSSGRLTLKIFFLIVLNDLVDSFAQLLMKMGLNDSWALVWLGIVIYTLNFFIWIIVLYKIDLSIAMPVGSFCYIFVPIIAILFLGEHVGPLRWIGILCIALGIHFVSQSKKAVKEGA